MRFWDTSAVIGLLVEESWSPKCRALLRSDSATVVWCLTRVEATSALRRRQREGALDQRALVLAIRRLDAWSRRWAEVDAVTLVRDRAERLLGVHSLKAADALQLAAALLAVKENPRGRSLVTADGPLARAATAEGFDVSILT